MMKVGSIGISAASVPDTSCLPVSPSSTLAPHVMRAHSSPQAVPTARHRCWNVSSRDSMHSLARLTEAAAQYQQPRNAPTNDSHAQIHGPRPGITLETRTADGMKAYRQYYTRRAAIRGGFKNADGSANMTAYNRYEKQRCAIRAGFGRADGSIDMHGYGLMQRERGARNAGLLTADGQPDTKTFYRVLRHKRALKAGFISPDGSIDLSGYNRQAMNNTAIKAGFRKPDGQADLTAYFKSVRKSGLNKLNVAGKDGCLDLTMHGRRQIQAAGK